MADELLTNEEALEAAQARLAELERHGSYLDRLAYTALVEKLEPKAKTLLPLLPVRQPGVPR